MNAMKTTPNNPPPHTAKPSTMSMTTTVHPRPYQVSHLLADYQLTHSQETALDTPQPTQPTPSDWPTTEHRRVPAYRAVNTTLDQRERRVYSNGAERAFVAVMFTGVFLQSVSSSYMGPTFFSCDGRWKHGGARLLFVWRGMANGFVSRG